MKMVMHQQQQKEQHDIMSTILENISMETETDNDQLWEFGA